MTNGVTPAASAAPNVICAEYASHAVPRPYAIHVAANIPITAITGFLMNFSIKSPATIAIGMKPMR